eukprot:2721885-Pyramimonas_sp.AAC.1
MIIKPPDQDGDDAFFSLALRRGSQSCQVGRRDPPPGPQLPDQRVLVKPAGLQKHAPAASPGGAASGIKWSLAPGGLVPIVDGRPCGITNVPLL